MLGPYGALLRVQGAFSFSSMGFVARMPISMTGLGAVLLVSAETGRYGIAGITAGVLSLSFAVISPLVARVVARFGQAAHRQVRLRISGGPVDDLHRVAGGSGSRAGGGMSGANQNRSLGRVSRTRSHGHFHTEHGS